MKRLARLYCWIFGHDIVEIGGCIDNGQSRFGEYRCLRCGHCEPWQYDYAP